MARHFSTRGVRAVVLAGGESRRMGRPKPLVRLGGVTLLARARRTARAATGREALVSLPAAGAAYAVRLPHRLRVRDATSGRGPAAGVLAALDAPAAAGDDVFLLLAVDMPLLDAGTLELFLAGAEGARAAVPVYRGQEQPACAILTRALRPLVERAVRNGHGLRWILARARARHVPIPRRAGPSPFTSVDTPAAVHRAARHVCVAGRQESADTIERVRPPRTQPVTVRGPHPRGG